MLVLRRFAYVAYDTAAAAANAVAVLNGADLEGRAARIELSKPAEERAALRAERTPAAAGGATSTPARESANIVVIGLPKEFDPDTLAKVFASCGEVIRTRVGETLARIRFSEPSAVDRALALSGSQLHGHTVTVEKERARAKKPRRPRRAAEDGAAPAAAAAPRAPRAPRAAAAPRAPRVAAEASEQRVPQPPRRVRVEGIPEGTTADQVRG